MLISGFLLSACVIQDLNQDLNELEANYGFFKGQVSGGGGTDFTPVFDWVDQRDRAPDLLIYFTDAEGRFPPNEPAYPSLWLVKGNGDIPWGQRIQLN